MSPTYWVALLHNLLPICLMIMAALSIFQAWICGGMGIGKFLNDMLLETFWTQKLHGLGAS